MGAFKMLGLELARLTEKKGVLFSVLGVLLVPIVYVAILLSATWSPYDNLDNLPVAFVNKDLGANSGGSAINIGQDLVEELQQNPALGWEFVSQEEANKGLKSQKYYMVVEIPEDFSQKASSVLDANPVVPELRYIQNEGLNFMASQVTKSATEKLREQLGNKITATYTQTLFSRLGDISNGFASGADGSNKLFEGTTTLSDGTSQLLQSLNDKSGDIQKLATGAATAESGAGQLLSSVKNGEGDIKKLAAGSKEVVQGINSLKAGSEQVLNGLKSAKAGSTSLTTGLEKQLQPGSQQLASGLGKVTEATKTLTGGSQGLTEGLKAYLGKHPELAQDIEFMTLVGTSDAVSKGLTQFSQQVQPLKTGADALVAGASQLTAGSKQLDAGLNQLVSGQTAATAGIDRLKSGATQVANGNATVSASWTKVGNAVSGLKDGLTQISSGNQTVAVGWETMTLGVTSLNDGATQLKSGSQELSTGLAGGASEVSGIQVSDANIAMFANPVTLTGEKVNNYKFYRDSTAPYIMSLALFVGILLLSFVVEFKRPVTTPGSVISWYASKLMQLSLFAIAQALIVSLFTLVFIKLQVDSIPLFILFTIFVSLTFMSIVFFLVTLGGNIGRFVALAFIVLQLSTTGSNLPIPMLPENLQALSKYLPLTYSNAGFKSIISLGDTGFMIMNMWFLLICLIVSLILTFVVFAFNFKRVSTSNHDNDGLTGANV
ncbi:YhgE/Pip family protein [Psychrobacillus psychrotolerans]|uniref:YhgE/Pip family protein n=1 Tax=Psychrobacillus psychrotolerans TaxID=126156 RepID=UPI00398A1CFE